MILHDVWNLELGFLPEKPLEIEPVQEYLSTDTGLLLFRQFDEQLGFTEDFAAQLNDVRSDPTHSILEMVRSRVFGILAGYEDQNDHDALRRDAIFKIIANRLPDDEDLASQPTLSRFENAVTPSDLLRLEDWFIQRFVDSFDEPPKQITLDIDVFDDPTHGAQQLTLFHGYYKQAAVVHRFLLSGRHLAGVAVGGCQVRSRPARNQSTSGRDQPAWRASGPPRRLRRIRSAWRKREPQQGTEMRVVCRPFERPPLYGQLLSHVSALRGEQFAGASAPPDCLASRRAIRQSLDRARCGSLAGDP